MRAATILLILTTSCYSDNDAKNTLRQMGRPEPIECNYLDSHAQTYACHDGAGQDWICSEPYGCTRWGAK